MTERHALPPQNGENFSPNLRSLGLYPIGFDVAAQLIQFDAVAAIMPCRNHPNFVERVIKGGYRYAPSLLRFD